jgi:hypothetical protein
MSPRIIRWRNSWNAPCEKAGSLLPNADLRLCIMPRDDGVRDVAVHAQTPRGVELLA